MGRRFLSARGQGNAAGCLLCVSEALQGNGLAEPRSFLQVLLLKHTLQQLLNMKTGGEDGASPTSGSAVPMVEMLTGASLCPLPRAVQQGRVKAKEFRMSC